MTPPNIYVDPPPPGCECPPMPTSGFGRAPRYLHRTANPMCPLYLHPVTSAAMADYVYGIGRPLNG